MEEHYNMLKTGDTATASQNIGTLLNLGNRIDNQTEEQALVAWMYDGYVEMWGTDEEWEIVAVEYANEFWLPTPKGGRSPYKVKVKIDLIVRSKQTRKLWIVDHKSCKDLPTDKMLELDDQFGLYTWGLQQLGKKVVGSIHNACRTFRYKDPKAPYPLDARFKRTMLYRTDEELNTVAIEAYKTARRAWGQTKEGEAERTPNSDTCRWRCDFTESCLGARKDRDQAGYLKNSLSLGGFKQDFERH
jgi:hypothetical protein